MEHSDQEMGPLRAAMQALQVEPESRQARSTSVSCGCLSCLFSWFSNVREGPALGEPL